MVGASDLVSDGEAPIPCRAVHVSRPLSVLLMLWPHRLHIAQAIKGHFHVSIHGRASATARACREADGKRLVGVMDEDTGESRRSEI
jgi:hypothetical protein